MQRHVTPFLALLGAALLSWVTSACAPVTVTPRVEGFDPAKAKSLAAEDHCLRCHGLSRKKEGPPYGKRGHITLLN